MKISPNCSCCQEDCIVCLDDFNRTGPSPQSGDCGAYSLYKASSINAGPTLVSSPDWSTYESSGEGLWLKSSTFIAVEATVPATDPTWFLITSRSADTVYQFVQITHTSGDSSSQAAVIGNWLDADNYVIGVWNVDAAAGPHSVTIYQRLNGTLTSLGSASTGLSIDSQEVDLSLCFQGGDDGGNYVIARTHIPVTNETHVTDPLGFTVKTGANYAGFGANEVDSTTGAHNYDDFIFKRSESEDYGTCEECDQSAGAGKPCPVCTDYLASSQVQLTCTLTDASDDALFGWESCGTTTFIISTSIDFPSGTTCIYEPVFLECDDAAVSAQSSCCRVRYNGVPMLSVDPWEMCGMSVDFIRIADAGSNVTLSCQITITKQSFPVGLPASDCPLGGIPVNPFQAAGDQSANTCIFSKTIAKPVDCTAINETLTPTGSTATLYSGSTVQWTSL